ncbi:uncharacterized protein CC84DRAFT_200933 [Paraphaeosphaeria sporulosa]|uniref:Uncharacterized protein n=1 Tax=Paraphaeosphaeria sporulosa TaxID=1460663 RepID=A0A177C1M1_9PLEO|nr:uncharacterized protein CC84DRAFT_200933 [Paraphaeosphaeria sporulosa]OAG01543.1 hypothetical protein CC84DRAFT_200933 [Paraphaeosphaeria sporulosa]
MTHPGNDAADPGSRRNGRRHLGPHQLGFACLYSRRFEKAAWKKAALRTKPARLQGKVASLARRRVMSKTLAQRVLSRSPSHSSWYGTSEMVMSLRTPRVRRSTLPGFCRGPQSSNPPLADSRQCRIRRVASSSLAMPGSGDASRVITRICATAHYTPYTVRRDTKKSSTRLSLCHVTSERAEGTPYQQEHNIGPRGKKRFSAHHELDHHSHRQHQDLSARRLSCSNHPPCHSRLAAHEECPARAPVAHRSERCLWPGSVGSCQTLRMFSHRLPAPLM